MCDRVTAAFPRGDGPDDEVLGDFGVSREAHVSRFREILRAGPPPKGLNHTDVAALLAVYS